MIDFIIWIAVGAIVGWIAGRVMGTSGGLLMDIIVGIVGAFLGGWLWGLLFTDTATTADGSYNFMSWFVSILGAVVLLAIVKFIRRGSSA